MITTTMMRMSGRFVKNLGWWQFLVLSGLCAWVTTPVDAQQQGGYQQGGYQSLNDSPASRGFMPDDGDDVPSPRGFGPVIPRPNQWDDRGAQPSRQFRPAPDIQTNDGIEHIDMRPGHGGDWSGYGQPGTSRRMSPAGSDPVFQGPRHRRSNFHGMDSQSPNSVAPNFSAPNYTPPSFSAPNYPAPEFQAPGFQNPNFQSPNFQAPNPQVPGYSGQPDTSFATAATGACGQPGAGRSESDHATLSEPKFPRPVEPESAAVDRLI
jgi:hypothetical protein